MPSQNAADVGRNVLFVVATVINGRRCVFLTSCEGNKHVFSLSVRNSPRNTCEHHKMKINKIKSFLSLCSKYMYCVCVHNTEYYIT